MKRNDAARSKLLAHDAMIENEPEKRCRVGERENKEPSETERCR